MSTTNRTPGPCSIITEPGRLSRSEAEAIARRFAASDELLALLSEAERVIRYAAQESQGRVDKAKVGGWIFHADKIRAAIAKAEGGAK